MNKIAAKKRIENVVIAARADPAARPTARGLNRLVNSVRHLKTHRLAESGRSTPLKSQLMGNGRRQDLTT